MFGILSVSVLLHFARKTTAPQAMNVILINESSKKALVRSRRVLSKYLPQIGSNVWAGQISQEGLDDLKTALTAAGASKNTAICCHRILSRSRSAVEWTVGSQASFDAEGRYAFRQTALKQEPTPPVQKSAVEKFSAAILKIAALCHDTGKAGRGFAEKLARGAGAETIRHDLLSFLVHAQSLWTPDVTDQSWLELLAANPEKACACIENGEMLPASSPWLQKVKDALQPEVSESRVLLAAQSELTALQDRAPGLATMLWLVLTHHRLPQGDSNAQQICMGRHLNHITEQSKARGTKIAPLSKCLKVAAPNVPWTDPAWRASMAGAAKSALAALAELPAKNLFPTHFWTQVAAHQLRPALVLSDHLGSKQSQKTLKKTDAKVKTEVFANLFDRAYYGDTLATHEVKVARLTRKVANLAHATMPLAKMRQSSKALTRDLDEYYRWQLDLQQFCEKAATTGPTFVSIIAETGAGKTLGSVRALNALHPNGIRATFALGLRSLTWQLASVMLKDAAFEENDVTVAVGHPETLGLDVIAREFQNDHVSAKEKYGSESSAGDDVEAVVKGIARDASWVESFCSQKEARELWGPKALDLLTAPIATCTADHLVASVSLLKGGDAKLFLRLAQGTLVLDESDSYSPEDLQSIAKLAFLAGSYGQNVILMSATMSPVIQAGLYAAWQQGVEVHCALKQIPLQFNSIFSSNTCASELLVTPDAAAAAEAWVRYVTQVSAVYAERAQTLPLRKLMLWELSARSSQGAFENIVSAAKHLHANNSSLDPVTGSKVSVGFVRLNTAKSAWKMAKYLAERGSLEGEPVIKFVAYHSKLPRNYLGVLDATLGQLTNRKDEHAFLQTPALREALDTAAGEDVLVLVCTTTLMETGRDFDFDWCVLEPRSPRGEIQAIGRVRRHRRNLSVAFANVIILDKPLRALDTPDGFLWGKPGIEDGLFRGQHLGFLPPPQFASTVPALAGARPSRRTAPAAQQGNVVLASDALPLKAWGVAMDAQLCILPCGNYAENRIGYLEQAVQELHFKKASSWSNSSGLPPSVGFYLNSLAPWNAEHALRTRFRGNNEATLLFLPQDGQVSYWDTMGNKSRPAREILVSAVSVQNALLPDLRLQAQSLPGESEHIQGCALRCLPGRGATKQATWDASLGFMEGTS